MSSNGIASQQNNGFGPIPEKRGKKALLMALGFFGGFILFVCLICWSKKNQKKELGFFVMAIATSLSAVIFGHLIKRLCLFAEEYSHLKTRYEGDRLKAAKKCFWTAELKVTYLALFCSSIVSVAIWHFRGVTFANESAEILGIILFLPLFTFSIGLQKPSEVELSTINESNNKNVADGLAWSYYFGYLKIVLPNLDSTLCKTCKLHEGKPLNEYIKDDKIFIVIPKNCFCYESFTQADDRIKFIDNTNPIEENRGGVQRRIYKNSVYRITANGEEFYCLMEYATPLMSLYDMADNPESGLSREERDNQTVLFFKKLSKILENDPRCKKKYHIVLTSDTENLANIMVREIKHSRNATPING
eukprot:gene11344-12528_t